MVRKNLGYTIYLYSFLPHSFSSLPSRQLVKSSQRFASGMHTLLNSHLNSSGPHAIIAKIVQKYNIQKVGLVKRALLICCITICNKELFLLQFSSSVPSLHSGTSLHLTSISLQIPPSHLNSSSIHSKGLKHFGKCNIQRKRIVRNKIDVNIF